MLKRIMVILAIVLIGIGVNDVAKYVKGQADLRESTYDLTRWAADNVRGQSREEAARRVAEQAAPDGVTIYQYGQTEEGIQIWTSREVEGTVFAGTVMNLIQGMSFAEARKAPFRITDYQESRFL